MGNDVSSCIIEKFEEDGTYLDKIEQYKKRIRKKAKKNKKLKRSIRLLEAQNEELSQKLKAMKRKYKKLKQNIQFERQQLGVNPFMPLDIFGNFKKGKKGKKERPVINVCCMPTPSWAPEPPAMIERTPPILDATFREVSNDGLPF